MGLRIPVLQLLEVGLDLDRWALEIIDGSRNSDLVVVDCSEGIEPLNVPNRTIDASMGDGDGGVSATVVTADGPLNQLGTARLPFAVVAG